MLLIVCVKYFKYLMKGMRQLTYFDVKFRCMFWGVVNLCRIRRWKFDLESASV